MARLGDNKSGDFETIRRLEAQTLALWRESFLSRWAFRDFGGNEVPPSGGRGLKAFGTKCRAGRDPESVGEELLLEEQLSP